MAKRFKNKNKPVDDASSKKQEEKPKPPVKADNDDDDGDLFAPSKPKSANENKVQASTLFDDDDEDEGLFKPKTSKSLKKSNFFNDSEDDDDGEDKKPEKEEKTNAETVDEDEEEAPVVSKPKLPPGAKSLFNTNQQLESALQKRFNPEKEEKKSSLFDDDEDDDLFKPKKQPQQQPVAAKKEETTATTKPKNLFDESEEEDDLFSPKSKKPETKKGTESLFDNDDDLFNKKPTGAKIQNKNEKSDNLFSELNKKLTNDPLNASKPPPEVVPSSTVNEKKVDKKLDIDDDDDLFSSSKPKPNDQTKTKPPQSSTLFDDESDDDGDLFSAKPQSKNDEPKTNEKVADEIKEPVKPKLPPGAKSMFNTNQQLESALQKRFNPEKEENKILLDDDEDDDLFKPKKQPQAVKVEAAKPSKPTSADQDDLFKPKPQQPKVVTKEEPLVKPPPITLSDNSDDDLFKPKKPVPLKVEPKVKQISSEDEDLFATKNNEAKIEVKKATDSPLFTNKAEDDDDDDLFSKLPSKAEPVKIQNKNENLLAELNKKLTVVSDPLGVLKQDPPQPSDDLVKTKPFEENTSPIKALQKNLQLNPTNLLPGAKAPIQPQINEDVSKVELAEEKTTSSIKSLQKNLLLNPANLLPGARPLNPNRGSTMQKMDENDPYGLEVDRTFTDQSIRNVQKDRIKVAQKKRPPSNRPRVEESSEVKDSIDFGFEVETPKKVQEKPKPKQAEEDDLDDLFKPTATVAKAKAVVEEAKVLKDDDLDLFKPTKSKADDDSTKLKPQLENDDLFANESLLKTKPVETKAVDSKKKKSNLDSAFKDDLDLFADVSLLGKTGDSKSKEKEKVSISTSNSKTAKKSVFSGIFQLFFSF